MKSILRWAERALIVVAAAMSIWCGAIIVELWYVNSLPIPVSASRESVPKPPSLDGASSRAVTWSGKLPAEEPPPSAKGSRSSGALVEPGTWLARLQAPAIGFSTTVLEGADDKTLARAAGHVEDTALPGEAGNTVIAGHRDTIFRPVRNLHVGDALVLTTSDYVYRYRITSTRVINPDQVDVLDPTDHRALTLVTCYPFTFIGHAPQRFIIRADLDTEQPRSAERRER